MDRWQGKVAVVTGASAGIGAAIVENLLKHGMTVVGLARRLDRLQELQKKTSSKPGKFYPIKCDLIKEEDILSAFKWIEDNLSGVHVLINNAGTLMKVSMQEATETEIWKELYNINILALQICSREAIKSMRLHKFDGQIINISSTAAHVSSPLPGLTSYYASKKAVNMIGEGLRVELGNTQSKIKVTTVSPGYTKTEITNNTGLLVSADIPGLEAEDVASTVEYVLQLPAHVLIAELVLQNVTPVDHSNIKFTTN